MGGIATDLIQTSDKKIVMVGWNYSSILLGGQPTMKPFIAKFDLNNPTNPIWKNTNTGILSLTHGYLGLVELSNQKILVCGILDTMLNPDFPNSYASNIFIKFTEFSQQGQLLKDRNYNYKNNDTATQYIQGMRSFHLCKDGGWVGAVELANYGTNPFFFVKYDSTGCDTSAAYCQYVSALSISSSIYNTDIKIFPNPSNGVFTIEAPEGSMDELAIYNAVGQLIRKLPVDEGNSITVSGLPSGLYYVQATKQKGFVVMRQKLVVEQ
jgi:hypothetical protein